VPLSVGYRHDARTPGAGDDLGEPNVREANVEQHLAQRRGRGKLRESADQLRAFHEIAQLVELPLKRPPDGATDYAAGAPPSKQPGCAGSPRGWSASPVRRETEAVSR
jgi:hypothetical protein